MADETSSFDKRKMDRYFSSGKLTQKDFEKYLKSLPDHGDQIDHVKFWDQDSTLPSERLKRRVPKSESAAPISIVHSMDDSDEDSDAYGE